MAAIDYCISIQAPEQDAWSLFDMPTLPAGERFRPLRGSGRQTPLLPESATDLTPVVTAPALV